MSEQHDQDLRQHFDHVDRDGNGRIDIGEFQSLLGSLNLQRESAVVAAAFAAIDSDANGKIDFAEFSRWWNAFKQS